MCMLISFASGCGLGQKIHSKWIMWTEFMLNFEQKVSIFMQKVLRYAYDIVLFTIYRYIVFFQSKHGLYNKA